MVMFSIKEALPGTHITTKESVLNRVTEALARRDGMCPCSITSDENHQCQCLEYRLSGICRCGLYVSD